MTSTFCVEKLATQTCEPPGRTVTPYGWPPTFTVAMTASLTGSITDTVPSAWLLT
jgi:hypothetical protein